LKQGSTTYYANESLDYPPLELCYYGLSKSFMMLEEVIIIIVIAMAMAMAATVIAIYVSIHAKLSKLD